VAQDISVGITADNSVFLQVLEDSKSAAQAFFETITEQAAGVGAALQDMQSKFSAAFQFTGVAAATAGLSEITSLLDSMGARATEIHTVSDVLGVTVEQMQAMQAAAEHAGVGAETLTRAGERLAEMLNQAQAGSGAAITKITELGVTTENLADPTFKLNDLLQIVHDRLGNAATKQDEMNALLQEFGTRGALATEAIAAYDGSQKSVAETMARLNGLSAEQVKHLQEAKTSWSELGTTISNTFAKLAFGSGAPDMSGMNALSMSNLGSAQQAPGGRVTAKSVLAARSASSYGCPADGRHDDTGDSAGAGCAEAVISRDPPAGDG
jgi:hypothetical protein